MERCGTRMTWTRSRVIIAVGLLGMVGVICFELYQSAVAERSMSALLLGDLSVEIVKFETEYQQRRVVCTDTNSLEYLKRALSRPAPKGAVTGGISYRGYFKFRSGGIFGTY